jgi:hypothetical protein
VVPRLRTIALLMLAAGLALGMFATRAFSLFGTPPRSETVPASPTIEERVQYYRARYHLDDAQTERIRQIHVTYQRNVDAQLLLLRQENAKPFDDLLKDANQRIQEVIETAAK